MKVISLNLWCPFSLNSPGLCHKVKGLKTFSWFSWREKREPYSWAKSLYNVVSIHCLPCICHLANKNKHPGSLRGCGIHRSKSMISSELRWFHRMHNLQKALNKACRQFTLYILVWIALSAMWVWRYSLSLKIYIEEETQIKVQIVTCPDILAFEMNSRKVLVQVTKK